MVSASMDAKARSSALQREQLVDQLKKRRQWCRLSSSCQVFRLLQIDKTDKKQHFLCEIIKRFAFYQIHELISTLPHTGLLFKILKFTRTRLRKPDILILKSNYREFMEALGFPAYSNVASTSAAQHSPKAQDAIRQQFKQLKLRMKNNRDLPVDSRDFEVVKAVEDILVPGFLFWRDTGVLFKNKELVVNIFEDAFSQPAYDGQLADLKKRVGLLETGISQAFLSGYSADKWSVAGPCGYVDRFGVWREAK